MEPKTWPTKYILTTALAIVAIVILAVPVSRNRMAQINSHRQQEEQRVKEIMPPVISSAKSLDIVTAYVDSDKQANIIIFNNSAKGIQGFAVSSGSFTLIEDDGLKTDNPKTIIEPFARYTIQLPASNLRAASPVLLSAVIYDDRTEDGDIDVRRKIHDARQREKEKRLHPDDNKELKP